MKKLQFVIFSVILTAAIFACISVILPIASQVRIHAQDLTPPTSAPQNQIKITIQNVQTSNVEIDFNLKGSSATYLTGFDLTFPLEVGGDVSGTINDNKLNITKETSEGKTTIKISTENLNINLGTDTWLKLNFQVLNLVKNKFGINYLYLPPIENNFGLATIEYDVSAPADFAKPSFISALTPNFKTDSEFTVSLDKSLFVIWGDSPTLNLKMNYSLKNATANDNAFLVNLPSNLNQQVSYLDFPKVDGGLYDNLYNNFAVKNVTANESADVNLNSVIKLKTQSADPTINSDSSKAKNELNSLSVIPKYNWTFNQDSTFSKNLITELAKVNSPEEKIQALDKYLINNLSPFASEKYDLTSLSGIWNKLNGVSQFNSLEYCYLAISAAEYLGYQGHLAYGYLLLPDFLLAQKRSPHVWCELNDGSKNYFMDPFLEDQFKLNYNFIEPEDRILFGNWDPSMDYNNILGLFSNDSQEIQAEVNEIDQDTQNRVDQADQSDQAASNLEISFDPQSGDIYSGDYYSADVNINNKSNYFLQLRDIQIDNNSYLSTLAIKNFYPALIPQKSTVFSFNNLIQPNLFYNANKSISSKIKVDNSNFSDEQLSHQQDVFFKISITNILKQLVIIGVVILLIGLIYKLFIEKRIRKFIGPKP